MKVLGRREREIEDEGRKDRVCVQMCFAYIFLRCLHKSFRNCCDMFAQLLCLVSGDRRERESSKCWKNCKFKKPRKSGKFMSTQCLYVGERWEKISSKEWPSSTCLCVVSHPPPSALSPLLCAEKGLLWWDFWLMFSVDCVTCLQHPCTLVLSLLWITQKRLCDGVDDIYTTTSEWRTNWVKEREANQMILNHKCKQT